MLAVRLIRRSIMQIQQKRFVSIQWEYIFLNALNKTQTEKYLFLFTAFNLRFIVLQKIARSDRFLEKIAVSYKTTLRSF